MLFFGTGIAPYIDTMMNKKILDWIEGYILSRMLIFGDFVGTVTRSDFLIDLDTAGDYFRKFEGQRIQASVTAGKEQELEHSPGGNRAMLSKRLG